MKMRKMMITYLIIYNIYYIWTKWTVININLYKLIYTLFFLLYSIISFIFSIVRSICDLLHFWHIISFRTYCFILLISFFSWTILHIDSNIGAPIDFSIISFIKCSLSASIDSVMKLFTSFVLFITSLLSSSMLWMINSLSVLILDVFFWEIWLMRKKKRWLSYCSSCSFSSLFDECLWIISTFGRITSYNFIIHRKHK